MKKRILYLSDYFLVAYQAHNTTQNLKEIEAFQNDEAGHAQFEHYLQQDNKTPLLWLIDSSHEEYKSLSLPHVIGKDRKQLLNHRKKRFFEYTPYVYAEVQGREKHGRGDDQSLFMALNEAELLQPWLNLIIQAKVPLMGISSVPLLSQHLLKYLPTTTYTLLVSHTPKINAHTAQALRQNFFINQRFQFSRIIPFPDLTGKHYAKTVIDQIITTQRYLDSARLLPRNANLTVLLLSQGEFLQELDTYLQTVHTPETTIHLIDNNAFVQAINFKNPPDFIYLHHLVAYQLLFTPFKNHYARAHETRYFFYKQVRLGTYSLSVLLMIISLIASGLNFAETWQIRHHGLTIQQQIAMREDSVQALREAQPSLPLDVEKIRGIVDYGQHLVIQHRLPHASLEKLSQLLNQHTFLKLTQLEWKIGQQGEKLFPDLQTMKKLPQLSQETSASSTSSQERPQYFVEGLRLHGKIQPFDGNYQLALFRFKRFVEDLQAESHFSKVKEVRLPFSIAYLSGEIDGDSEQEADFVVDIFTFHNYE